MDTLIIAEKPSVALRLAIALGDNKQKRLSMNGVGYYQIDTSNGTMYIAPAVGHVFTLVQASSNRGYPVLEVKWAPSYQASKNSEFTKKYLDVLMELAKKSKEYVNACDYDTEGTVIGTNIIMHISADAIKNARRMKFSTTTIPDIKSAYANLMPLDINNFYAGEARHVLDWLWGINLSRALTSAMSGAQRALSIGRVQGPTLALLAEREKEARNFIPKPFWKILAVAKETEFTNTKGDIFEIERAKAAHAATQAGLRNAIVESVEENEQPMRPYPPFDLTSLQLEASRTLRYDPSTTLAIAQSLYERAYISYPRTSSQKLPPTLGLSKVITELAKNPEYAEDAKKLIAEKRFRPNEGAKSDEAHPAIYPTGVLPKALSANEAKLYDLIARRFLSCFASYAKLAKTKVMLSIGSESYIANGTRIIDSGWLALYRYAKPSEKLLPVFSKGERPSVSKTEMRELQTQPPRHYTKASLIAELEKRDLGTKGTRASIIDTLFKRGYIDGSPITVTEFGMSVYEALHANVQMIIDEETTRQLEKDMEQISIGKKTEEEVIDEGKRMLLDALKLFDSNKEKISQAMKKGLTASTVPLGKCPTDGGDLVIKRSRQGKQFVACANYPNCTTTFSLPQAAKIVPTGETCEFCKTPIIKVIRRGKGVFTMDLDPNCRTKDKWRAKQEAKASALVEGAKQQETEKIQKVKIKKVKSVKNQKTKLIVEEIKAAKPAKKAKKTKKESKKAI